MQRERRKIMIAMFQQMQICLRHNSSCGYGFLVILIINIFNFIFLSFLSIFYSCSHHSKFAQGTMLCIQLLTQFSVTFPRSFFHIVWTKAILSSTISFRKFPSWNVYNFWQWAYLFDFSLMWSQRHRQAKKGDGNRGKILHSNAGFVTDGGSQ